jgi:single-strand DNA-binding protein
MIRASVYGRLGGDPAAREARSGSAMATASLGVEVSRPGSDASDTEWLTLVAFGTTAGEMMRNRKGDLVAVMGQMSRSRFTDRNGQDRASWGVVTEALVSARTVRPRGSRKSSGGSRPGAFEGGKR